MVDCCLFNTFYTVVSSVYLRVCWLKYTGDIAIYKQLNNYLPNSGEMKSWCIMCLVSKAMVDLAMYCAYANSNVKVFIK